MASARVQWNTTLVALALLVVFPVGLPAARGQQRSADRTGAIIFPDEMNTRYEAAKEKRDLSSSVEQSPEEDAEDWSDESLELPISHARQLAEINSTADLLALLDPDSIDQRIFMNGGDYTGRDIGENPVPASCEPELQLVTLRPDNLTGARTYFYPTCTRVKRCNGCCNTNQLVCEPVTNRTILYKVATLEHRGNGKKDKFLRMELVPVEEHIKCKCQCRVKESDCNELQAYNPNNCRCECTNKEDRNQCLQERQTKQWNANTCTCDCIPRTEECTSGTHFDRSACKCIPNDFYTYDGAPDGSGPPPSVIFSRYPSFANRKRSIIAPSPKISK